MCGACSATGWRSGGKPKFEIKELRHSLKDSNIPMPTTLLRLILNATLPRLLHRGLLTALPPELGQYLLDSAQEIHVTGAASDTICISLVISNQLISEVGHPLTSCRAGMSARQPGSGKWALIQVLRD